MLRRSCGVRYDENLVVAVLTVADRLHAAHFIVALHSSGLTLISPRPKRQKATHDYGRRAGVRRAPLHGTTVRTPVRRHLQERAYTYTSLICVDSRACGAQERTPVPFEAPAFVARGRSLREDAHEKHGYGK